MEISFVGLCITIAFIICVTLVFIVSDICDVIKDYIFYKPKYKLTKDQLDKLYKLLDEEGGTNGKTKYR